MAGQAVAGGQVRGVNILVPSSWYEFDIHPAVLDESVRAVVDARIAERPELAEHRSSLARTLRKVAREAWTSGVVYFGAMVEVVDEEPMMASLMITVTEARDEATGQIAPNRLDGITAALREIPRGRRPTDPWREVSVVELPEVGHAARTRGIEDIEVPNDARVLRMALMQTFVPFPGGDPRVAIISASTPQLALAEPMFQLFDGITDTFRFLSAESEKAN